MMDNAAANKMKEVISLLSHHYRAFFPSLKLPWQLQIPGAQAVRRLPPTTLLKVIL